MSAGPPPLLFYGPPRRIPFFALVFLLLALVAAATTVQDGFQIISKQNGSLVAAAAAQGLGPSDNITATSTTPRSDNIDKESWTLAKPLLNETTTSTPAPKDSPVATSTPAVTPTSTCALASSTTSTPATTTSIAPLSTTTSPKKTVVTVGYLTAIKGNLKDRQGLAISGALTLALEEVNNSTEMLPQVHLEFRWNDTKGDTVTATQAITEMICEGVAAFFGPEGTCWVESIVAQSRNIPMISYKCPEYRASKNEVFARTEPPDMQATKSLIALLKYYKWNKFSIIAEEEWRPVADALKSEAVSNNMTINHYETVFDRHTCCEEKYPCCQTTFWYGKIKETRNRTRIYVFLGSSNALIDMMNQMQGLQMFDQGEYMVIYVDKMTYSKKEATKYLWKTDEMEKPEGCMWTPEFERKARSLLVVVPSPPNASYEHFATKVREYNTREPFFFPTPSLFTSFQMFISMYAAYLYDSVQLYARALDDLLKQESELNETVIKQIATNGTRIIQTIINYKTYQSITGATIKLDRYGDSEGNFSVLMYRNITLKQDQFTCRGQMYPVGRFVIDLKCNECIIYQLKDNEQSDWMFGSPPKAEPFCGFDNENCSTDTRKSSVVAAGTLAVLLFCATVVTISIYRKWKIEQEIEGLLWKIKHEDLHGYFGKDIVSSPSKLSLASANSYESRCGPQVFATTGHYRNVMVRIKELKFSKRKDIARDIMKEMRVLRDLRHDNINSFIGACLEPMRILIITDYCAKGSLYDIVENEDIKLDIMFIASLVHDLIKAMVYLHQSALGCHGNLKSSNCVVTSRWVLQVTDFGLHELRHCAESESIGEHQYFRNLFWKAPELLRDPNAPVGGTQKGDVYAFAIVVYEIFGRRGPFGISGYEPKEIIELVKQMPGENDEPFRPNLDILRESETGCADYILSCIQDCWHENPEMRPDFSTIRSRLKKMKDGMHRNIVDHMMAIMERYADNLEDLVSERTRLLYEEKQKTEDLLHRMLPAPVASRLTLGIGVEPESFDSVTIYFSDIVGFTAMSAESSPLQVVNFLNDLYTLFDRIIKGYDVYKVETIGDAYMVVSGLPLKNGDKHAGEIASMSLDLLSAIKNHRIAHRPNETLKLRIGVHTGPVVAGVVGLTMPRYCLFGDTVNTASRMESNGEPLKIHISPQCKDALEKVGGYLVNERGMVYMKGKGEVKTYWLIGATDTAIQKREVDLGELPPLFCRPRRSPKLNSDSRHASISGNFFGGSNGSRRQSAIPRGASVDVESTSTFATSRLERQVSRATLDASSPQQNEESKNNLDSEVTRTSLPRLLRESRSLDPFPISDSRFARVSSRQPLTRSLENCLEASECFNSSMASEPSPSSPSSLLPPPLTNGNVIIPLTSQDEELISKSEIPGPQTTDNGLTSSGEDIETPLLNRANEAVIITGNCHMRRGRSGCGESTAPELASAKRWKSLDQVPGDNIPPGLGQNKKLLERGSIRSWLFGLFNRNGLRTSDASLRKGIHSGYTDLQAEKESIV